MRAGEIRKVGLKGLVVGVHAELLELRQFRHVQILERIEKGWLHVTLKSQSSPPLISRHLSASAQGIPHVVDLLAPLLVPLRQISLEPNWRAHVAGDAAERCHPAGSGMENPDIENG